MPYVKRDSDNQIIAAATDASGDINEYIAANDPDFMAYHNELAQQIATTDTDIVRVLEDLIDILVAKKVIAFEEFPAAVQRKLLVRKDLRWQLQTMRNKLLKA
jgi:hypothetical protein